MEGKKKPGGGTDVLQEGERELCGNCSKAAGINGGKER